MSPIIDIASLSPDQRLTLIGELWDSLDPNEIPLTDAQKEELDRRLDDLEHDPSSGTPWQVAFERIRKRPQ